MRISVVVLLGVIFLMSCGQKSNQKQTGTSKLAYAEINLSEYGIPVSVTVPEGPKVEESIAMSMFSGFGLVAYEIKKDNFVLEVTCMQSDSLNTPADRMKSEKEMITDDSEFDSFVEEGDKGFIYKKKSESGVDYNFFYVVKSGNSMVEFRNGMRFSNFSLDEVKEHYKAAQTAH